MMNWYGGQLTRNRSDQEPLPSGVTRCNSRWNLHATGGLSIWTDRAFGRVMDLRILQTEPGQVVWIWLLRTLTSIHTGTSVPSCDLPRNLVPVPVAQGLSFDAPPFYNPPSFLVRTLID
jgi:hypothetical protein